MEDYGIFKSLATENAYVSLTKTLNSTASTVATQKTLRRITTQDIVYAHMGQLIICEGICYATFIQNPGNDGEDHDSVTSGVVLAVFKLEAALSDAFDAQHDVSFYPIGSKGDTCAGYTATSIFKDNSMCLVGEQLHICFSFIAEDGRSHIFRKTFCIRRRTWVDEAIVTIRYHGEICDFSDQTINRIYQDHQLPPRAKGLIELVSAWNEWNGEYYATGLTIGGPNHGFVAKTKDFCTMDFVDVIPFNDMGSAEIASCIFKDKLFVACRQHYGIPWLYLGALELKTGRWLPHHRIPDGNVRPWFFVHEEALYLMNTVEEKERRYTNISRIRTLDTKLTFFNDLHPVEVMATLKDCGSYFATAACGNDIYFVCTHNTESFGKLCLRFYDEDAVNRKLLSLLTE